MLTQSFPKIEEVLRSIEKEEQVSLSNDLSPVGGLKTKFASIPRTTGQILEQLIVENKYRNIVEVGCSVGYSTLWLAKGALQTHGQITTSEIKENKISLAKANFKNAGVDHIIKLVPEKAQLMLDNWQGPHADFIFIDAFKKEYVEYFQKALPILAANGNMVFDNVITHHYLLEDLFATIQKTAGITQQLIEKDNGLLIVKKS